MRVHGRIDSNQIVIVAALRQIGAWVQSVADVGNGCPDLIVAYHGRLFLLEVKAGDGKLTAAESDWIAGCERIGGVAVHIVRGVDDALRTLGAI